MYIYPFNIFLCNFKFYVTFHHMRINLYKQIKQKFVGNALQLEKEGKKPLPSNWRIELTVILGATAPALAVVGIIASFGFFPFPFLNYVIGSIIIVVVIPVLGLKAALLPYAFNHIESFNGIFALLFALLNILQEFKLTYVMNLVTWMRSFISKHPYVTFFSVCL